MKKYIVFGLLFLITVNSLKAQITFTVKPGLNLNGANLGYKVNKTVPYIGLQFLNVKQNNESNDPSETNSEITKTHVFMPYVGSKFLIIDKGPVKGSINATIFKPMIFGKETVDGKENESYKNDFKELKLWGGELGFCSEYFFEEHFSIGGEFGYRFGFYKHILKSETTGYLSTDKLNINMTYISVSLNFYF